MSDLWLRVPPTQRGTVIRNSLVLRQYRDAARDNHLAMRRRYDFGPQRLVWDFGEYNAPGIYGMLELNSFGSPIYAEIFGRKFYDNDFDTLNVAEFFFQGSKDARKVPITIVTPEHMLQAAPNNSFEVAQQAEAEKIIWNQATGDFIIRPKITPSQMVTTGNIELPQQEPLPPEDQRIHTIDAEGAVTPKRHAWTWFVILLVLGVTELCGAIVTWRFHNYYAVAILFIGMVCAGIGLFAVVAYWDDNRNEALVAEQHHHDRHRHRQ